MAKVTFTIRSKNNPATIYVRFVDKNSIDIRISTNLTINPIYWSLLKKWLTPNDKFEERGTIEDSLNGIEQRILKERNNAVLNNTKMDKQWLEKIIDNVDEKIDTNEEHQLYKLIENYKNKLPNRIRNGKKGVSEGTIRNYNTTMQRLKKFNEAFGINTHIKDVDLNFHEKYIKYATEKLNLSQNSIGKDIRQFKTVCLDARDIGIKINDQLISRKFNAPNEKTLFTTLTKSELLILFNFKGSNYLENARDWLIIGCWTACRVGDLMKLNESNLINIQGTQIIRYEQSKTKKIVSVPVHPDVKAIITKNGGFPRAISSKCFNEYIKTLCKEVDINELIYGTRQNPVTHIKEVGMFEKWQLVRSHICRRSFASNHYNELPNKLIMAVTGHSTERMLLNYIGVTEIDHIDDFITLWKS